MGKKCQISVEQVDDKCFAIEFSTGMFAKKHMVSETRDNLILKVSAILKSTFSGDRNA